jgi:hypothetical protein
MNIYEFENIKFMKYDRLNVECKKLIHSYISREYRNEPMYGSNYQM